MNPLNHDWLDVFTSSYRPTGTKTYRLASSQFLKPLGQRNQGFGSNGQNRSDEERRTFRPPPGYKFAQCDLEGAEAVAVALFCTEGKFRDLIRHRIKPHNFMCVHLFPDKFKEHLSADDIPLLDPAGFAALPNRKVIEKLCKALAREYDLAKRTVHGANYSMGWKTFRDTVLKGTRGAVILSARQAKEMLALYFHLFPEVKLYQARIEEAVRAGFPICNLFGHTVTLLARFTTDFARLAIAWGPQSTVGQCTNFATAKFQRFVQTEKVRWNLHNITHDSGLISAPADEIDTASKKFAEFLTYTFKSPLDGWQATIGVERQIGDNWGKYNERENPTGLKVVS